MPMETDDRGRVAQKSSLLTFLGGRLRKARLERGWSQGVTAQKAHSTGAMISYVENAKRVPTEQLTIDLDVAFETDFFHEFYPLLMECTYPDWFRPYVELEQSATAIRVFDSQVVSGLLQTEDYARAVLSSRRPACVEDLVVARMSRQLIFERPDPPRLWVVLDENALGRPIGGTATMRRQLEYMIQASEDPRVVIQVIPRSVTSHPGLEGPFTLLSFAEGDDVLYVDGFSQGRAALSRDEVVDARHAYDLLLGLAASPAQSVETIRNYIKEYT